jgi:hypothetical protein
MTMTPKAPTPDRPPCPVARPGSSSHAARWRWTDAAVVSGMEFATARETDTLDKAYRLVHDQYVSRDLMLPEADGRKLDLRHALPSTRVFVAKAWPLVVGTVSLFQDSPLGLPLETEHLDAVSSLRRTGRRLAEVSHLAVDVANQTESLAVIMRLLRMVLVYAAEVAHLDELCLVVPPRYVDLCRRYLEAQPLPGTVAGGPSRAGVALHIDLDHIRRLAADVHAGRAAGPMRTFLFGVVSYREVWAQLRQEIPGAGLSSGQFAHFFGGDVPPPEAAADTRQYAYVESLHALLPGFQQVLDPVLSRWEMLRRVRQSRGAGPGEGT